MTITVDATKGWALPANASEWTSLLSGTGIANPDSAWPGQIGSGNLVDVIGSLTLTAKNTPLYGQAATGWASTGVGADDGTADGFTAGSGTGPNPNTTSQVWMAVISIEVEPTATRTILGVNGATPLLLLWVPAAGVNKLRINCAGTSTTGTADHGTGSYVIFLRYDRAASAAVALSDLETVTGTYASTPTDGNKGYGAGSSTPGSITLEYLALWSGANAESLDNTKIGTIRSRIESPPGGTTLAIPSAASLTLSPLAPSLATTLAIPSAAALTLSPLTPALSKALGVPSAAALTLTGLAPSLSIKLGVPVASLALTGLAPTLLGVAAPPATVARLVTAPRTALAGLYDQALDPITLDYIDTTDGEWLDRADSRTLVMIAIDTRLGKSYSAPAEGTRVRDMLELGTPVTPQFVQSEITRVMQALERDGVIAGFTMRVLDEHGNFLVDESGRFSPELRYLDLATGSPVDLVYTAFGVN